MRARYSIITNLDEVRNASKTILMYDKSIPNIITDSTNAQTFVLLNTTISDAPTWGTNWQTIKPGILSGSLNDEKTIIIGVNNQQENITDLAKDIY